MFCNFAKILFLKFRENFMLCENFAKFKEIFTKHKIINFEKVRKQTFSQTPCPHVIYFCYRHNSTKNEPHRTDKTGSCKKKM